MTTRQNFGAELRNKEAIIQAAADIGCIQTRGKTKGEGSLREMLENIGAGEILVLFHQYDDDGPGVEDMLADAAKLRQMAEPLYPSTLGETLKALAAAMESTAQRRDG
jgi:hypothetical protein